MIAFDCGPTVPPYICILKKKNLNTHIKTDTESNDVEALGTH